MEPHDIKVEIYKRRPKGLTMASIARDIGVTKQAVALVIERRQTSWRIAQKIAESIEMPFEAVFPELANRRRTACN